MRTLFRIICAAGTTVVLAVTAGCGGGGSVSPTVPFTNAATQTASRIVRGHTAGKIQHVIIIMQENRSFDNLLQGFPGADTQSYGYDSNGNKVTLNPISLATYWDLDHSSGSFFTACHGKGKYPGTLCRMDGFNNEWVGCGYSSDPCPYQEPQYAYVPHDESAPYFAMGEKYVVADRMFASHFDASSFISHQYIISGEAGNSAVDYPNGAWGCDGGPSDTIGTVNHKRQIGGPYQRVCWDDQTIGDEADAAGVTWAFYDAGFSGDGGFWNAYDAIRHIRNGPDWNKDMRTPQTHIFSDLQNGDLPNISWVIPTWENSDHAGNNSDTGPSWVTQVVNAIGQSKYWNSTAIFILWDDYGGWYDHVAPHKVDYRGLGMRLPLIIISPYAKKGYVSHVPYEHGSILRFIEDQFGLGQLAASDKRATSPQADSFDFNQKPRPFTPFQSKYDRMFFLHQPLSHHPVDDK